MTIHYDKYQYPVGVTCTCGHSFPIDVCTGENLQGIKKDNGINIQYTNVAKCPECGKLDLEKQEGINLTIEQIDC